jgi:hypothetical protein
MNALAKHVVAPLGFIAIGVAVSLAVALPQRAQANPDPSVSYVWRGMAPSGQYCYPWGTLPGHHPCWHDDEIAGEYTAIDYSFYWPDSCAGEDVWLDYTGDFQLFKMEAFPSDYACTGVRAKIYLGNYNESNYKGDIHYLHIDPNDFWMGQQVPYQSIYIDDVLEQEKSGCPWDAPHLHQSARVSAETPFYTSKLADATEDNEWVHAIMWEASTGDQDGDEFTNQDELYIGTDPFDNCPDSSSDDAWPRDINNDTNCNIADVFLFKGHMSCTVGEDCYDNRFDLNVNGSVDIGDVYLFKGYMGTSCD